MHELVTCTEIEDLRWLFFQGEVDYDDSIVLGRVVFISQ